MGLLEYASIAVIVYIALSVIAKFTLIAMYLYGMYQFMKDDTPHQPLVDYDKPQPSVDSDEFNPDYL